MDIDADDPKISMMNCRHGVFCHFKGDTVIGKSLSLYGEWAEEEVFLFSELLHRGDTVFDIGANVGTHTIPFSRFVGASGHVVAIDGNPTAYGFLSANIVLNGCTNVTALLGVVGRGSSVQFVPKARAGDNLGAMNFHGAGTPTHGGSADGGLRVPVAEFGIDLLRGEKCDAIKIDVEGMEIDVLWGARKLLVACKPYVYFEQTSQNNFKKIHELLSELKYKLYWHLSRPFNSKNFNKNPDNIFGSAVEVQVLAIPEGRTMPDSLAPFLLRVAVDGSYSPPAISGYSEAWGLPDDAYRSFAESEGHDVFSSLRSNYMELQRRFDAILEDRKKAQEIMEFQALQLQKLRSSPGV